MTTRTAEATPREASNVVHLKAEGERKDSPPLRDADRLIHAALGAATGGISPISLMQAWQDWALHLAISPGKQLEIQLKGWEKLSRLSLHMADCAARGPEASS
jgi:hypothetical protein